MAARGVFSICFPSPGTTLARAAPLAEAGAMAAEAGKIAVTSILSDLTGLGDSFLRMGRGDPKTKRGKVSGLPLTQGERRRPVRTTFLWTCVAAARALHLTLCFLCVFCSRFSQIFRKSNGKVRPTTKKRRKNKERIAPSIAPPLPEEFTRPFGQGS